MRIIHESLRFKIAIIIILPPLVILSGSAGFYMLEKGWTWNDAIYMTVITVSTVGYGEVHNLSENGKIFSMVLILLSMGIFAYCATMIFGFIAEGGINLFIEKIRMENAIEKLENHYIVCGNGRKGRAVCRYLKDSKLPFVVIDKNPDLLLAAKDLDYLYMQGDLVEDYALIKARINNAKGVVAMLGSDPENVFLVLTAKQLNPNLEIVAWAADPNSEKKLYLAGANRVLTPYEIGGFQVVQSLIRPAVLDFLEFALDVHNLEVQLEQIDINNESCFVGKTLQEIQPDNSLKVLSIIRNGKNEFEVTGQMELKAGDILIVIGPEKSIKKMQNFSNTN